MKKKNTFTEQKESCTFYFKQIAITIAGALTMSIAMGQYSGKYVAQQEFIQVIINSPKIELPEEVTISGLVKDEAGKPLANAPVRTAFGDNNFTDKNGAFSFKLKKEQVIAQSIFASYEGLETAVRSYHPVMANTVYDITLYKPRKCCIAHDSSVVKPLTVNFRNNSTILSKETKKQLDEIANSLKEKPTATIFLTAHTANRKTLQKIAELRLDTIKNYLIEQNGISGDRINTDKIPDNINNNSVDVKTE